MKGAVKPYLRGRTPHLEALAERRGSQQADRGRGPASANDAEDCDEAASDHDARIHSHLSAHDPDRNRHGNQECCKSDGQPESLEPARYHGSRQWDANRRPPPRIAESTAAPRASSGNSMSANVTRSYG